MDLAVERFGKDYSKLGLFANTEIIHNTPERDQGNREVDSNREQDRALGGAERNKEQKTHPSFAHFSGCPSWQIRWLKIPGHKLPFKSGV
jgi:hypothetical protein